MRIDLQEVIAESKLLLEKLQNGTLVIITRASPITWEALRDELERQLVPILEFIFRKIGGLMEQPHVVLPDGVTSTSLVTQSEMVQFVTDTLNTWLGTFEDRVGKNSIYTFQPNIVALKYEPFIASINASPIMLVNTEPSMTVSKKSKYDEINILPFIDILQPIITVSKGD